jgi:hypothetical protein
MTNNSKVIQPTMHIVHCIDTEGPMKEEVSDTFKRLNNIFGLNISPSKKNLKKLQNQEIDLDGKEADVARVISPNLLNYKESWEDIEEMLDDCMSEKFRNELLDNEGKGWVYSWHCMDHIGYTENPRNKDIGYGNVYKFYKNIIKKTNSNQDEINWHYHPLSYDRNPLKCATNYFNSHEILNEIICRRIIDHKWFPTVNRPGFHSERIDIHLFLEQWIPFDYANNVYDFEDGQNDLAGERFGDWRRASKNWCGYNPSHDDYQLPGTCRRTIFRCLNVGTRFKILNEKHVLEALNDAEKYGTSILAFANHDWRDIRPDVEYVRNLVSKTKSHFPNVNIKFSGAREAARSLIFKTEEYIKDDLKLICYLEGSKFIVEVKYGELFGPQPYLAIKTHNNIYLHDNFDVMIPLKKFSYTLDFHTINLNEISVISAASSDKFGNFSVCFLEPQNEA